MSQQESAARVAGGVPGSDDLQDLKAAKITMDEYLERRLALQVAKLGGFLSEEQQNAIRELLLANFMDDPGLRELANRARGKGAQGSSSD